MRNYSSLSALGGLNGAHRTPCSLSNGKPRVNLVKDQYGFETILRINLAVQISEINIFRSMVGRNGSVVTAHDIVQSAKGC
ncbi:hypothetical protein CC78DRAFT_529287 [Lojkania enalia]|uniref:Uncharacterized protein n=1 Tax=Lojkania enalia TaxID=147567 RepID=A0A9P4NAD9_9PLEO|nr:hypothetical protein CC78DRAFT_529287 [Didymosphaeria enalia]